MHVGFNLSFYIYFSSINPHAAYIINIVTVLIFNIVQLENSKLIFYVLIGEERIKKKNEKWLPGIEFGKKRYLKIL